MSKRMWKQYIGIALWVLTLLVVFTFPEIVPSLTGFEIFLFPFIAVPLLILSLLVLVREKHKLYPSIALVVIVIIFFASITNGFSWGAKAHFYLNRNRYEAVVAQVLAARDDAERTKLCGNGMDDCWILSSDPIRISFHYHHAFLNWYDLVYDPTGTLNQKDVSRLHELNVYLFGAEHLTGNWYLGHFGD